MTTLIKNINSSLENLLRQCHPPSIGFHLSRFLDLRLLILVFLILVTAITYCGVWHNDFINIDDDVYITNNLHVKEGLSLKSVYWAFTSTQNGQWSPVSFLSHLLDCTLFGLNAGGHHFTSLLFHTVNTLILFFLLFRMTTSLWPCAFIAAIFAFHPIHVESVAWVAERRDVLHTFFLLLAIFAYINYVKDPKRLWHVCVLICFILAVMSKPMAVTLPFILLLLDYWPLGRIRIGKKHQEPKPFTATSLKGISENVPISHLLIEKSSLFFIAIAISLFTLFSAWGIKSLSSFDNLPMILRLENAAVSYIGYFLKIIWPNPLAVLYPYPITLPIWKVVCATLLLFTITVLVTLARNKYPYLIVGWLWYLITLLPVIGLFQAGDQSMADRFMYVPMIGLLIMMVYGISHICRKWPYKTLTLAVISASIIIILIVLTRAQVKFWRNSEALFRHTLQVTTNNYFIHNHLGAVLLKQGRGQEALVHFNRALEINPYYADAHCNLGVLLLRQGKYREAIPSFTAALRYKPHGVEALTNLGIVLGKYGQTKEAMELFSEAMRTNPNYEEAHFNRGSLLLEMKEYKEAIQSFNIALKINSRNSKTYNNLGVSWLGLGNAEKAMDCYHRALDIDPNDADTHCNLATLFIHQGKYEKAISHLAEALRINPNDGEVHFILGMLRLKMNQNELALEQYTALKNIDNKMAETLYLNISKYRKGGSKEQ
ncbi:MAG TPA: tetratricopeptide repeat protein [Thermodesulfobacteriota bacterium]|nr:tetratricopeptide repeat protein [Thermodesulfobacteriota bacterium]